MTSAICDDRKIRLGKGPSWHPERHVLFWFDLLDRKLPSTSFEWHLTHTVSAAGWPSKVTALFGLPEDASQNEDSAAKSFMAKDALQGLSLVRVKLAQHNTEPTV